MAEEYSVTAVLSAKYDGLVDGFRVAADAVDDFKQKTERSLNKVADVGRNISSVGSTLTDKITKPAIIASGAIATMVSGLDFKRLVGADTARAKLKGLGYEAEAVERISGQVETAIMDGMTTMAEGIDIAAGGLAANVKEGKELERYIKLVGDAAVGANRDVGDMAQIFHRIQGNGKLTRNELDMINHSLPGFSQAMAKHVGAGSLEAFHNMVSNGSVGSEEFLDVMEDFAGGMASAYSDSWAGMAKNTLAYVGIIGESLIGGLFEDGKKGLASFIEMLQSPAVLEWAEETGKKIKEVADLVVDKFAEMREWWQSLSEPMQDLIQKLGLFGGAFMLALGPVLQIGGRIMQALPILGGIIGALTSPITLIIIAIGLLAAALIYAYNESETFREIVHEVFEKVQEVVMTIFGSVYEFIKKIWGKISDFWQENGDMVAEATENIFGFIMGVVDFIMPAIKFIIEDVWGAIQNIFEGALGIILGIVETFSALFTGNWSGVWSGIKNIVSGIVQAIWGLINLWFVGKIVKVAKSFGKLFKNAIKGGMKGALNVVTNIAKSFFNAGKNIVNSIANGIKSAAGAAKDAIGGVASSIRNFLPFSPAKDGPLRDIMNVQIAESIAESINKGKRVATRAMGGLASALHDNYPMGFGDEVGAANRQVEKQLTYTVDSNLQTSKQSIHINLSLGNRDYETFVDDITRTQDRKVLTRKSFA